MNLVITAKQPNLNGKIDERFGRCEHFVLVNTEDNSLKNLINSAAGQHGGAGIAAAQLMIDNKVHAVASGAFGPNAYRALKAAGISMYLFGAGVETVQQAVEGIKQGTLTKYE